MKIVPCGPESRLPSVEKVHIEQLLPVGSKGVVTQDLGESWVRVGKQKQLDATMIKHSIVQTIEGEGVSRRFVGVATIRMRHDSVLDVRLPELGEPFTQLHSLKDILGEIRAELSKEVALS